MGLLEEVEVKVRENARSEAEAELVKLERELTAKAYPWNFIGGEKVLSDSFRDGLIKAKQDAAIQRLKQGLVDIAKGKANYEISVHSAGLEDRNRRRQELQRAIDKAFRGR